MTGRRLRICPQLRLVFVPAVSQPRELDACDAAIQDVADVGEDRSSEIPDGGYTAEYAFLSFSRLATDRFAFLLFAASCRMETRHRLSNLEPPLYIPHSPFPITAFHVSSSQHLFPIFSKTNGRRIISKVVFKFV